MDRGAAARGTAAPDEDRFVEGLGVQGWEGETEGYEEAGGGGGDGEREDGGVGEWERIWNRGHQDFLACGVELETGVGGLFGEETVAVTGGARLVEKRIWGGGMCGGEKKERKT